MSTGISLEDRLKQNGVRNMREIGYVECDTDNILTHEIYSAFFTSMLEGDIGKLPDVDYAIRNLLSIIRENAKGDYSENIPASV